jgi:hypothetical protein
MRESDDGAQLPGGPWPPSAPAPGRALVCGVALPLAACRRTQGGARGAERPRHPPTRGRALPPPGGRGVAAPHPARRGERAPGGDGEHGARRVARSRARRGAAGPDAGLAPHPGARRAGRQAGPAPRRAVVMGGRRPVPATGVRPMPPPSRAPTRRPAPGSPAARAPTCTRGWDTRSEACSGSPAPGWAAHRVTQPQRPAWASHGCPGGAQGSVETEVSRASRRPTRSTPWALPPLHRPGPLSLQPLLSKVCDKTERCPRTVVGLTCNTRAVSRIPLAFRAISTICRLMSGD